MNTTKIIRALKDKEHSFTRISNQLINDERLSDCEVGIMVRILTNSDEWIINKEHLAKKSLMTKGSFTSAWKKLIEFGYIKQNKVKGKGKVYYEYEIIENPPLNIKKSTHQIPHVENPQVVNGILITTNIINDEKQKTREEKETGESGSSIGSKKDNVEDTPTFSITCSKSNEKISTSNAPANISHLSLIDEKTSINNIKKQKILNLDFLKNVKDIIAILDYEELVEHLNEEFQDIYPLSPFEKHQLDIIVNCK